MLENQLEFQTPKLENLIHIDAEEYVLGALILDPPSYDRIKNILEPECFYLDTHRKIFESIKSLNKEGILGDLTNVYKWLIAKQSGITSNDLYSLVESCVSSVNIDNVARLVARYYFRRSVVEAANKTISKVCDISIPLEESFPEIKRNLLSIVDTGLDSNSDSVFDFERHQQRKDEITLSLVISDFEKCEATENPILRSWRMKRLARDSGKKYGIQMSQQELSNFYTQYLANCSESTSPTTASEYYEKNFKGNENWLIRSWLAPGTLNLVYAAGGVGKTRFTMGQIYSLITGENWCGYDVETGPVKTLFIQTDQSPHLTSQLLDLQGFLSLPKEQSDRLLILDEFQIEEYGKLERIIKESQNTDAPIKMIIIDSLTSVSSRSIYRENDTEYARPLIRYRQLAKNYGITFVILHHTNSEGNCRGTKAIFNTVDNAISIERIKSENKLNDEDETVNIVTFQKSRNRGPGKYLISYDMETATWKIIEQLKEDNSILVYNRKIHQEIIEFLKRNKGQVYDSKQIADSLGKAESTIRKELSLLKKEGRINFRKGNYNRVVHYLGEIDPFKLISPELKLEEPVPIKEDEIIIQEKLLEEFVSIKEDEIIIQEKLPEIKILPERINQIATNKELNIYIQSKEESLFCQEFINATFDIRLRLKQLKSTIYYDVASKLNKDNNWAKELIVQDQKEQKRLVPPLSNIIANQLTRKLNEICEKIGIKDPSQIFLLWAFISCERSASLSEKKRTLTDILILSHKSIRSLQVDRHIWHTISQKCK